MEIEDLKTRIESFSELKKNWDSYEADEITSSSIITAHSVLDFLSKTTDINSIAVFPMRDGGIQFEIGEYKEIEILNCEINEIDYNSDYSASKQLKSVWKEGNKTSHSLGLAPKWLIKEQRRNVVSKAISRCLTAGLEIPIELINEYNELIIV